MLNWKKDIEMMHKNRCTVSDVLEYIDLHMTEVNEKEVFEYIDTLNYQNVDTEMIFADIKNAINKLQNVIENKYKDEDVALLNAAKINIDNAKANLEQANAICNMMSMSEEEIWEFINKD